VKSPNVYTAVSATVLMVLGVVGFAFYDQFHIPVYVLLIDLILGFWGLYATFAKK
jgi:hypothetical protein